MVDPLFHQPPLTLTVVVLQPLPPSTLQLVLSQHQHLALPRPSPPLPPLQEEALDSALALVRFDLPQQHFLLPHPE